MKILFKTFVIIAALWTQLDVKADNLFRHGRSRQRGITYSHYYPESGLTPNIYHDADGKRGGRTYTDIAKVINPNQYAFPGSRSYPGQPFWPHG